MTLLFVYGTLKKDQCRAHHLQGQTFVGIAKTLPGYGMFKLDGYPGLIQSEQGLEIVGEVWKISPSCVLRLDQVEGVDDRFYQRQTIDLAPPFDDQQVEAYFYLGSLEGREDCGECW